MATIGPFRGEFMYRRCKPEDIENPFMNISITELSHNRSGSKNSILSIPEDVLFNIVPSQDKEKHEDLVVAKLMIVSLNEENKYLKQYEQIKDGQKSIARMELLHEPEPCIYPHCVFRVWINDNMVTYDNYKFTLNKLKQLKTEIKEELASMIIREQISQNDAPLS